MTATTMGEARAERSRIARAAGGLAAALGLVVLGGWHGHRMDLVRVLPAFVPMQYDDALGFFFCGASLAALTFARRRAAVVLGTLAAVLALWSLIQGALGAGTGLEGLFADGAIRDAIPEALRQEPLSACALLLAGGALAGLGASRSQYASNAALLAGAALAGFGAVVFLCYVGGIASAFGWEYLTRVPVHSGAGFAAVGTGLLSVSWPQGGGEDPRDARWLPVAVGLAAATAAVFLWLALKGEERSRINWMVDATASELKDRLQSLQQNGGLLAQALKADKLFGEILPGQAPRTYAFSVSLGAQELYASPGARTPDADAYARDVEAALADGSWRLRVWPSTEFLNVQRSILPDAVLAVGLLLAALLAWSMQLTRLARRQAREIAREHARAEAASEAKSRFLANISREPRNPLNMIVGYTQLLLKQADGPLNPAQEADLRTVLRGARLLTALFDELMELAQLEAGKVRLERKDVSAAELLEDLRSGFAENAKTRGIELRAKSPGAMTLRADPERLKRALSRVLENALKFTPKGTITLAAVQSNGEIVFSVSDTGLGFSREEKGKLFEPFWQSDRLNALKKTEGLGLGLHLARRVVELHGGRIEAQGEAGAGSVFRIWIPREAVSVAAWEAKS